MNKIMRFIDSLTPEELRELVTVVQMITDPLGQELLKRAIEEREKKDE